ncbi:ABC transporter ATP-binding protein [Oxynema aestuarii]|uniref:ABC transporter ATP-binding protein n=1 Tax=Oxynema aestuarii AP17 TaxID=2064643 RepID=A0A6H1U2A9_9CYAN|nr:ABC transporter ATP-binding protein [Oxynema aestuarii]QIZ72507.1 ABC transporter ATP-binding protein [Oxynema aestuarii AP17]
MSDPIIQVENLGKKYIIGHQKQERYTALRDVIANGAKSVGQKLLTPMGKKVSDPTVEEFWALKDVSFEIKQGDRVGIIGRNGAGKSTLLKILSRITEPTTGRISIKGRVASLLEVGTGFHPELTGRENIYLNGAILGMSKVEIKRKFDEIVAFAEVEKFLDTPVKRYSSGMYVRLAFAVAAHLEPEILIVDEVLAVGDAQFQKKCLGKMEDVGKEGRTVLFVSHQMAAIQNLCQKAIWLNQGEVITEDKTDIVIGKYLKDSAKLPQFSLAERKDRKGTGVIKFTSFQLQNNLRESLRSLCSGQSVRFIFYFENSTGQDLKNLHLGIGIDNQIGERITVLSNEVTGEIFSSVSSNIKSIEIYIKRLPLTPGRYGLTIYSAINGVVADWIQNAGFFDVESGDYYGRGKIPPSGQGNFLIDYNFQLTIAELSN